MSSTDPPAFCAASPYARPRPRGIPPRAPHSRTAAAASSYVLGRISQPAVGAVRPQPVTVVWSGPMTSGAESVSADMSVTVSPSCE